MSQTKYLFIVTGSISVYKTLDLVSKLKKENHLIKVVMTKSATRFVSKLTFASLVGGEVYTDLWDEAEPMNHIELIRWAEEIIVAPATANFINKMANGIADDLASCLFMAHKFDKPFRVYPAMNTSMLDNPITSQSLEKLSSLGIIIGRTQEGILACGEKGAGKLLEIENIYKDLKSNRITNRSKKILITSGGTKEPIDGVRHIGNMSSGKTGSIIARELLAKGYEVDFFYGNGSQKPNNANTIEFTSFEDLDHKLKHSLSTHSYDYIIHLAAISDYSVSSVETADGKALNTNEKLSSSYELVIKLKPNKKIIGELKNYSRNKKVKIIGFKLTNTTDLKVKEQAIQKVFEQPGVNLVIHNELKNINEKTHQFEICSQKSSKVQVYSKEELAFALCELINDEVISREIRL